MHGRAFVQPFVVDASQLRLPGGFSAVTIAGRAIGVLGLIEYRPPSPLVYSELVWMPCLVRAGGKRGYFIEKMYVDSDASLAGGREIWAIPKQKARFEIGERSATIDTEDGAHLVLELRRRGPAVRAATGGATLQAGVDDIVRFRGTGSARISSGSVHLREARGLEGWTGWTSAHRMPAVGIALEDFAITMREPVHLARGM
jgi:hypothetical protein